MNKENLLINFNKTIKSYYTTYKLMKDKTIEISTLLNIVTFQLLI